MDALSHQLGGAMASTSVTTIDVTTCYAFDLKGKRKWFRCATVVRRFPGSQLATLTMGEVVCEELEDLVHFSVHDLPGRGYVVMEEIRRQGKLCDVTLKVQSKRFRTASVKVAAR